jgi:hypothetical protein
VATSTKKEQAAAAAEQQDQEQASSPRLVKYMGAADVRVIEKGDDFGGTLSEGLPKTLEWNWDNRHVVDVTEAGLTDAQVETLLAYEGHSGAEFKDVTDMERIPVNRAQQLWRGAKPNARLERDAELPTVDTALVTDEEAKRDPFGAGGGSSSGTSDTGTGGTTGGTTAGGGGTAAAGGSAGGGGGTANLGGNTAG